VRESGEHDVIQSLDLATDGGDNVRMTVSVHACPPGGNAVQKSPAVGIDEPAAPGLGDRDGREFLEIAEMGGRMPHGGSVAVGQ
jgi:hypothetical protein